MVSQGDIEFASKLRTQNAKARSQITVASLRKKAADEPPVDLASAPVAISATEKMQAEASTALKRQIEALHRAESLQQQQHAAAAIGHRRGEWLAANLLAQRNVDVLDGFHREALQQGHADLSDD